MDWVHEGQEQVTGAGRNPAPAPVPEMWLEL